MSFNVLALTFGFHTYLAYVISKMKKKNFLPYQIKVQPINPNEKGDNSFMEKDLMEHVRWINTLGKVVFFGFMIIFNAIFWVVAFMEHLRPVEEYISKV